jgi:hypothetical protein
MLLDAIGPRGAAGSGESVLTGSVPTGCAAGGPTRPHLHECALVLIRAGAGVAEKVPLYKPEGASPPAVNARRWRDEGPRVAGRRGDARGGGARKVAA